MKKVLLRILAAVVTLVLVVVGIRVVNGIRYPADDLDALRDPASYALTQEGVRVERVQQGRVQGFHLRPGRPVGKGLVIIWGGSEGGPDFDRAVRIAQAGHEVLALFFFGQPNQAPALSEVPIEFFGEVLAYAKEHAASATPLTLIGTSKGAELALVLAARHPEIDNVVLYAPPGYVYQGLDPEKTTSTWSEGGRPLPFVHFRYASGQAVWDMLSAVALNAPISYRSTYATAPLGDPDAGAARLQPERVRGHLLVFAGEDDQMLNSAEVARSFGQARPERTAVHTYPGAGHVFDAPPIAARMKLGGTVEANRAALEDSTRILLDSLARWHA